MNGNLVRKPSKEETEFEEEEEIEIEDDNEVEEDDDNDSSSSSKKSFSDVDPKKRLFILMGIIVGVTVLLLLFLFIASLFTTRKYDYNDMETILKEAAISYFADYPESLPAQDNQVVEIDSSNLVYAGKMKDLSEYRDDGVVCTGKVQVEKISGEYVYTPFLNCGDSYSSVELFNKIESDNQTVTSGDGLYSYNRHYVFRGEKVNNYVQLENSLWRVVKITADGNVVMIHATGIDNYEPWDDRYNEDYSYEAGINKFNVSRIKEYLQKIYATPEEDSGEDILSDKDRSKIVPFTLCVGGRTIESTSKTNNEECRLKAQDQKLGLLTLSDYLYASLDSNCKNAESKSCMNYNYLAINDEWWLATPNSGDSSEVFVVDRSGIVKSETAGRYAKVRPVIYLNSHAMYAGGTGTEKDPYTIK